LTSYADHRHRRWRSNSSKPRSSPSLSVTSAKDPPPQPGVNFMFSRALALARANHSPLARADRTTCTRAASAVYFTLAGVSLIGRCSTTSAAPALTEVVSRRARRPRCRLLSGERNRALRRSRNRPRTLASCFIDDMREPRPCRTWGLRQSADYHVCSPYPSKDVGSRNTPRVAVVH